MTTAGLTVALEVSKLGTGNVTIESADSFVAVVDIVELEPGDSNISGAVVGSEVADAAAGIVGAAVGAAVGVIEVVGAKFESLIVLL